MKLATLTKTSAPSQKSLNVLDVTLQVPQFSVTNRQFAKKVIYKTLGSKCHMLTHFYAVL